MNEQLQDKAADLFRQASKLQSASRSMYGTHPVEFLLSYESFDELRLWAHKGERDIRYAMQIRELDVGYREGSVREDITHENALFGIRIRPSHSIPIGEVRLMLVVAQ